MLKLKLQYFGHVVWAHWKSPDIGKDWGQERKGETEDETIEWHHRLNGHEFEQTPKILKDKEAWNTAAHGGLRVGHDLVTEQ